MKLYVDDDRYGDAPASPLVEAFHSSVRDLVRQRLSESGGNWAQFVFGSADKLISKAEISAIEARIVASGYRFTSSSMASVRDRPQIYKPVAGVGGDLASFSFEHANAVVGEVEADGRQQRGVGDNVVRYPTNIAGTARYIRTSDQVIEYMSKGVPAQTIAVIDDSGGTLTAPIIDKFAGVICAGGTVRSHLGILTREYGIPCLMNARMSGIKEGDQVEIETSAVAKTAEAYQTGVEMTARIWRRGR